MTTSNTSQQTTENNTVETEAEFASLKPSEAQSFQERLRQALGHPDLRLYKLAVDAITRASYSYGLFGMGDLARLRKAAEAGDMANRLYASALLLAMAGRAWSPKDLPAAA